MLIIVHMSKRIKLPTPPWFRFIRTIALGLSSIGLAIISVGSFLPSILCNIGGYMVVAGAVAAFVAQTAVEGE